MVPIQHNNRYHHVEYYYKRRNVGMVKVTYNLASVAEKKKMSLSEIARRVGASKSYISYIARNRIHPSLYMMLQIADVLDVPLEKLYTADRSIS